MSDHKYLRMKILWSPRAKWISSNNSRELEIRKRGPKGTKLT